MRAADSRLSAVDAAYLALQRHGVAMNLGGATVLDPPAPGATISLDQLVARMAARSEVLPRLRERVYDSTVGRGRWGADPGFDVARHVREVRLPMPGTVEHLESALQQVHAEPFDLRRPLWDVTLIRGLADGSVVVLFRFHHAMVDGMRAIALVTSLCDGAADSMVVRAGASVDQPADGAAELAEFEPLADDASRRLRHAWQTAFDIGPLAGTRVMGRVLDGVLALLESAPPRTSLGEPSGQDYRVVVRQLDAALLRRVRRGRGTAVAELAVVAGALARLFAARGERCPLLRTVVPMGGAGVRASRYGNVAAPIVIDLPTGPLPAADRLAAVEQAFTAARTTQLPATWALLQAWDDAPAAAQETSSVWAAGLRGADALVSVMRWPRPVPPFLGWKQRVTYPVLPIGLRIGLLVGLVDLGGGVGFGITADPGVLPEAGFLAAAAEASLRELAGSGSR